MSAIKQGITDLIEAKRALEARLHLYIRAEINAFHEQTGATVDRVDVDMVAIKFIDKPPEYIVPSVRVSVPLD